MEQKTYASHGKCLFYFSIAVSLSVIYLKYFSGDFINNLSYSNLSSTLVFCFINIVLILGGFKLKEKYPQYYRYQIKSGSVLLITAVVFDLIPRLML